MVDNDDGGDQWGGADGAAGCTETSRSSFPESHSAPHRVTQHHTESHTNTASYRVTLSISQSHTASYRVGHRIFQRWTHHNPKSHTYTLPELNTATPKNEHSFNTGSHIQQESHIVSGWDNHSISESPKLMMTWFHDKLVGYRKLDPNVSFPVSPEVQMLFSEICKMTTIEWFKWTGGLRDIWKSN